MTVDEPLARIQGPEHAVLTGSRMSCSTSGLISNWSIYHYIRPEHWYNVCVCVEVVTAFMKHVTSHVSGGTNGSVLIDAGWSSSNAVWLVAYRM